MGTPQYSWELLDAASHEREISAYHWYPLL